MKKIKIKSLFLLLLAIAMSVTPLRVSAMDAIKSSGEEDNENGKSSHDRAGENSRTTADQAAKASGSEAAAGAGSGFIEGDDSGQAEASAMDSGNQKAGPDNVDLDENYLIGTWREAEETAARLRIEQEDIQKQIAEGSLSPSSRNAIKSAVERDRNKWSDVGRRYSKFIQEATESDRANTAQQHHILNLIASSNEASRAAQELLDFLSQRETSRDVGSGFIISQFSERKFANLKPDPHLDDEETEENKAAEFSLEKLENAARQKANAVDEKKTFLVKHLSDLESAATLAKEETTATESKRIVEQKAFEEKEQALKSVQQAEILAAREKEIENLRRCSSEAQAKTP